MENTLANKAKVFALYWGQRLLRYNTKYFYISEFIRTDALNDSHLQLKSISSISDEDKAHLGLGHAISFDEYGYNYSIGGDSWDIDQVDYLRSKGYALPAYGLSEEELVNRGWIVITSPNSPTTD